MAFPSKMLMPVFLLFLGSSWLGYTPHEGNSNEEDFADLLTRSQGSL